LTRSDARYRCALDQSLAAAGLRAELLECCLAPGTETALKPLPASPLLALALAFGMVSHDDALARHVACRATDVMRVVLVTDSHLAPATAASDALAASRATSREGARTQRAGTGSDGGRHCRLISP